MKLAYSIILFFLFLSNSSQAQPAFNWDRSSATDKEKAGYTCSANLLIMTMGDPQKLEPELGTVATIGGMILSELAAYETIGRTGQDMSMGEIFSIRDQEIEVLLARYNFAPDEVLKDSNYCLSWAASIIVEFEQNNDITPEEITFLNKSSVPNLSNHRVIFIESAFNNWKASGYIRPSAIKEAIRRQVQ